jgi:hypothetical protein
MSRGSASLVACSQTIGGRASGSALYHFSVKVHRIDPLTEKVSGFPFYAASYRIGITRHEEVKKRVKVKVWFRKIPKIC